jgi:hypothetical protein
MPNTTSPSKEAVRYYMQSRTQSAEPLPSMEEIRRKLGWYLRDDQAIAEFCDDVME